ncbi:MAG TPA: stage V sporulation protein AD [Acholeplasmataceae bacterium]|jgi:stage V sporulation protein AD|nr:stage V sporulation protein AD [Acholeplasmataceae bacterium]
MKVGKQSVRLENVYLGEAAVVTGPKEKNGPLNRYFDKSYNDLYCNAKTWEKAEMQLLSDALEICLKKNNLEVSNIDYFVGGDLNNQLIIGNYVLRDYDLPYLGVFGACSTATEAMIVGSALIESNFGKKILVGTSSHNATSERQFRYPTEYGGQKPDSMTFTVTAAGVALLTDEVTDIKVTGLTAGKVIDGKLNDPLDMGRAMAPAAFDTIYQHFEDFNVGPDAYDLIVTGDLSYYGRDMVVRLFKEINIELNDNYRDCGLLIYDRGNQDVFAGGSGCGCCAAVTFGYLLSMLREGHYKKILVVATGALLNAVITAQKETIPGIAHAVVLERMIK